MNYELLLLDFIYSASAAPRIATRWEQLETCLEFQVFYWEHVRPWRTFR
jgi:hypothetical protein